MATQLENQLHYDGDQCMRFMEALGGGPDFCAMVAVKYAWRIGRKEGETTERDVKNIRWYLDRFERLCDSGSPTELKYRKVLRIVETIAFMAWRGELAEDFHAPALLLAALDPEENTP